MLAFDRYYTYHELTQALHQLAQAYPHLCTLRSLGQSFGGRQIWLLTLTDPATGGDQHKPAYYLDGQIHAEEHAPSVVALHTAWYLLDRYGHDPLVTQLLAEQTFYIVPRVNPDGAEISLQPPFYRWCGNGRYQPGTPDERTHGLYQYDLDGDGYIARMRVEDPAGEWKVSSLDPRLMVQREPGEVGGQYYRLYPEGLIPDYDGVEVEIEPTRDGNLNRQFPGGWEPESRQYGAGLYPGSEPESRALIDFFVAHPNICGVNTFHTHGGLHLRPSGMMPDAEMNPHDRQLLQTLGERGTQITGYPCVSVYEEFTPDKSKVRRGCLDDWTFEELGIPSFTTELWDVETEAGIIKHQHYNNPRSEADQHLLLQWVDQHLGEQGFRSWRSVQHPQLGRVEVGGWVDIWVFRNPPPALLPDICLKNTLFCLEHAAASPRVHLTDWQIEPLGEQLYRVRLVLRNLGFLPTHLSDTARRKRQAGVMQVVLELEGAQVVVGQTQQQVGPLAGRDQRNEEWSPWGTTWERSAWPLEWVVQVAEPTARLRVEVSGNQIRTQWLEYDF